MSPASTCKEPSAATAPVGSNDIDALNTPVFTPVSVKTTVSAVVSLALLTLTVTVSAAVADTLRSASETFTYSELPAA